MTSSSDDRRPSRPRRPAHDRRRPAGGRAARGTGLRVQGVYQAAACWAGTPAEAERMTLAAFGAAYGTARPPADGDTADGNATAGPYRELVTLLRREEAAGTDGPRGERPDSGRLTRGGRALRTLPLEERFVVYLADVEDRPLREVADIVDTPAPVVRDRLWRGHRRLAGTLPSPR